MHRQVLNSKNWDPRFEFSDNDVMDKRNIYLSYLFWWIQIPNLVQGKKFYEKYPHDMVLTRANWPIRDMTICHSIQCKSSKEAYKCDLPDLYDESGPWIKVSVLPCIQNGTQLQPFWYFVAWSNQLSSVTWKMCSFLWSCGLPTVRCQDEAMFVSFFG